jgi:tRNA (guanine37-N1)-methyltransferase
MSLRFDLFTLFPEICTAYLQESILKRAQAAGLVEIAVHNIRDYAPGKHQVTDDIPYGGGGGMVMKPEPVFNAVEAVLGDAAQRAETRLILLTPQGRPFTQAVAQELAGQALAREAEAAPAQGQGSQARLALICGRYEGFDERIRTHLATDEISLGDFVLTGGELAALAIVDAVTRLLPGALGDPTGAEDDSFASGLLEYPHYTRPPDFRGLKVPEILLSGDHGRILRWRREQALRRTFERRPDLLLKLELSEADKAYLTRVAEEIGEGGGDAGRQVSR